ncbi:MAG: glycoside hydrolase family 3 C-terminal domain-containing protein [Oscillospiraceae bacterium]|nr:glycoside hydrolase family 3 C-terminal domain-containing protein [Oscillospiraceae bacterium]
MPMKLLTKASYSPDVSQREKENLQVAYQAACEGMVLLKNDGALPFKTKKVALYGPGASMTIKGGTGSGEVNERHSVTILEGLENRGFEVTTHRWIEDFEKHYAQAEADYKIEKKKRVNLLKMDSIMSMLFDNFRPPVGRAITAADVEESATDSCIYVLSRQAGEGGDRKAEKGDMFLTDEEREAIRFCAEKYENFLLVINCGSSIDMAFAEEIPGINAILYLCQLGTEGGHAFADVLSGAVTPSGKLSDTWARQYADLPFANEYSYLNGDLAEEYYKEGIFVGYRYFDSFGVEPAYPFGFGLSYTDFSIHSAGVAAEGSRITVKAAVTNTGDTYDGKEVVQLYVSAPNGALCKEYQSLAAFAKTDLLKPGQQETVELVFDLKNLASYREADASYVLEAGDYILRMGNSSRNTMAVGVLQVAQEILVSKHENICPVQKPFPELNAEPYAFEAIPDSLPHIRMDSAAFEAVTYTYEIPAVCGDDRVQAFLNTLTLKDMVDIVVGAGMFGVQNRFDLPGSVGNTTSKFWDKGLANVALCDGPAGLRIQKRSAVDKKGKIKPIDMALSIFEAFPSFVKNMMTGDPEKDTVLYQYTTAFPVANALAQTWNTALMYEVGTAVYREMKEYGCTYWLAPAINIHRNPLCGRNFEYFSEDPRLSGAMAAAITRGVQQEEGFYVTVKHYACNNQEDNRNFVSSNLSERALREIYLRGFEICVREGGAKGIMTSYNKINGVYAPNCHDICTKTLRNEWGFDGVVMTDWFSTNKGQANNALAMKAGNDLIMPGGGSFKKEILQGVKSGIISEEDVRRCCSNVVKSIFASATQKEYIG